jgi:hypothetical protein
MIFIVCSLNCFSYRAWVLALIEAYETVPGLADVFQVNFTVLMNTEKDLIELLSPHSRQDDELREYVHEHLDDALYSNQSDLVIIL